jgi:hypothetical protein
MVSDIAISIYFLGITMQNRDLAWDIVALYRSNPMDVLSINEIAKRLGKKYPYVHKRTNELIREGILHMMQLGRSNMCALNLENRFTRYMLGFAELQAQKQEHELPHCELAILCGKNKKVLYMLSRKRCKIEGVKTYLLDEAGMVQALLQDKDSCWSDHQIIRGIERFTFLLLVHKEKFKMRYNPIVRVLL